MIPLLDSLNSNPHNMVAVVSVCVCIIILALRFREITVKVGKWLLITCRRI